MSRDFLLPDLGEGLTEVEVVRWLVETGDTIAIDQPVVEVETAKAAVEVPSPYGGTVLVRHGEPGQTLLVGQPLLTVETSPAPGDHSPPPEPASARGPSDSASSDGGSASGSVLVGYGTQDGPARKGVRHRRSRAAVPPASPVSAPAAATPERPAVVSPLVRRLALDGGLDLAALRGSGPDGLILRRDVAAGLTGRDDSNAVASAGTGHDAPVTEQPRTGETVRLPMSPSHRAMATVLSRSRREIPEATVWVDVDVTRLVDLRAELAATPAGKVSLLALLARFTVAGLLRFPDLNARIDGTDVVRSASVHLGLAAQTPRGLVVPVLHDAQQRSVRQLNTDVADLVGTAREGRLSTAQLTGGTFTLNNYGPLGVDGSAAIINHPEVAILGIGRILPRPWVVDGQVLVRHLAELTLAFDHRACDGGTAGGFLRYVADCLEHPSAALVEL